MGQQQLLLLVLGIVIVGIAIVVGINAYSENSIKSNFDALLQDALRIASDAQSWKQKPEDFGGSPDATKAVQYDFSAVDFVGLAYSSQLIVTADNLCYSNQNGNYLLIPGDSLGIVGGNVANQNQVTVTVGGVLEADVNLDNTASIRGGELLDGTGASAITDPPCTAS